MQNKKEINAKALLFSFKNTFYVVNNSWKPLKQNYSFIILNPSWLVCKKQIIFEGFSLLPPSSNKKKIKKLLEKGVFIFLWVIKFKRIWFWKQKINKFSIKRPISKHQQWLACILLTSERMPKIIKTLIQKN